MRWSLKSPCFFLTAGRNTKEQEWAETQRRITHADGKEGNTEERAARAAISVLREQLGSLSDLFLEDPCGHLLHKHFSLCLSSWSHQYQGKLVLLSHCHFQSEKSCFRVEFALQSKVRLIKLENCVVREPWHYHRVRKLNLKLEPDHSSQWRSHALCQDTWHWILFNNFCIIV